MIPHICVVDNAADYRFLLQLLFYHDLPQYSVAFYASGRALLQALPSLEPLPRLIILDQYMPGLTGQQVVLHLKNQPLYKRIPVVIMSAAASSPEVMACYEAGVNSFMQKPVEFEKLRQRMSLLCQYWLEMNMQPQYQERT